MRTRTRLDRSTYTNLRVISWNINGGFDSKWNDGVLCNLLCTYDVICLSECWLENKYTLNVAGFKSYVFPRLKTQIKQGGGMIILVRDEYADCVSVSETFADTIVWMKVDKMLFDFGTVSHDVYFAFTYFPPCSSSFYARYDVDLFYEIEQQISHYMSLGKVCMFGDFNSRNY
jgi:exonuclease III